MILKWFVKVEAFLILVAALSAAQIPAGFVQVTATVPSLANGAYGASWTNLSSSSQLALLGGLSTFQQTVNGTFDANGSATMLLADTAQIIPSPSTWTFQFTFSCPTGSPSGGFFVAVAVTGGGGTEDISSQIIAALPTTPCGGALPSTYVSKTQATSRRWLDLWHGLVGIRERLRKQRWLTWEASPARRPRRRVWRGD